MNTLNERACEATFIKTFIHTEIQLSSKIKK